MITNIKTKQLEGSIHNGEYLALEVETSVPISQHSQIPLRVPECDYDLLTVQRIYDHIVKCCTSSQSIDKSLIHSIMTVRLQGTIHDLPYYALRVVTRSPFVTLNIKVPEYCYDEILTQSLINEIVQYCTSEFYINVNQMV